MPQWLFYGLDLITLGLFSIYTLVKFIKYDSDKNPKPLPLKLKANPCAYGYQYLEDREEEIDWYALTSNKEDDEKDEGKRKEGSQGAKAEE